MKRTWAVCAMVVLASVLLSQAQGLGDWGENTDPWKSPKTTTPWAAESLFIGATFLRDTTKDFIVWLRFQEAGCIGNLYLMVPGGAVGGGDTAIYLFRNHDAIGTTVNLTNNPIVKAHIHHMDTIFFMYHVRTDGVCCGCDTLPRYTGPNRAPGDGFVGTDRYYSPDKVSATFTSPDGTTHPIGRRWSVAGWIRNAALGTRTDTVEFGYEDLTPGDADYDDNIFHVLGVFLIRPASLVNITINAQPATATIPAGDSVTYTASVYIDSIDQWGQHFVFLDPVRSGLVTWALLGDTTGGVLRRGAGPSNTNTLYATKAYKTFTVQASIRDPKTGQILQTTMQVTVTPSLADHMVVENGYSVATGLDLNRPNPVKAITLPSAVARDSVYAIIRDRFENFVSVCPQVQWNVIVRPDIVSAATTSRSNTTGEGVITKLGPVGVAQVQAKDGSRPAAVLFMDTLSVTVTAVNYTALRFVVGTGGTKQVITSLVINLTDDTLIYAEAHREDGVGGDLNDGWVRVLAGWRLQPTPPLVSANPAPGSDSAWLFAPISDTGSGTITIRYSGLTDAVLNVRVKTGGPDRITLYSATGAPAPGNKYQGPNPPDNWIYQWTAGTNYTLVGNIFDPYGIWLSGYQTDPTLQQYITWELRNTTNGQIDNGLGVLSTITGAVTTFSPRRAYDTVDIIVTYNHAPVTRRDTLRVSILPGNISRLVIERDSAINLNVANRLGRLTMQNTATTVNAYAILRDAYDNFVKYADSAGWASRTPAVATAAMGSRWQRGQGAITRVTANNDSTWVAATYLGLKDSVLVTISAVTYDSLQIYVLAGGIRYITTLDIRTDQDTTLHTRGKRSDNAQWEDVDASWTSPGITPLTPPPSPAGLTWVFHPTNVGAGRVIAQRQGSSGIIRDTVLVNALPGLPGSLALYPKAGSPGPTNLRFPDVSVVDTITAGQALTLVGKLFDANNVWLSSYERASAPIVWRVIEQPGNNLTPTGTLTPLTGYLTAFTPTRAYNTVDIRADFSENGRSYNAIARFYVRPAAAARLLIEPSPTPSGVKLNEADELASVNFANTDTIKYAFAVLRDQFGNFVSASKATDWVSRAPATAGAREGNAVNGEGVLVRMARSGQTYVLATNRPNGGNPAFTDSVNVVLQQISYSALRIIVGDSTEILQLRMPIGPDFDTLLTVQGKRSDNGRWENVPGNWAILPAIPTVDAAPQASDVWHFYADDTGSALIVVTMGSSTPDTVRVRFGLGKPDHIVLYPATGIPGSSNAPYPPPTDTIVDSAGRALPLVAKVFDYKGYWLSQFEGNDAPITWSVVELAGLPPTGHLAWTSGASNSYTPTRARNSVFAIAKYDSAGQSFFDTVLVTVVPGRPQHLTIEPDQDWNASKYADNPVDTVRITSNETYRHVYAMVRDTFGNFVSYSTLTSWSSADTALASAEVGTATIGEGNIKRKGTQGITSVTAAGTVNLHGRDTVLVDNTVVQVLAYYYVRLRILEGATHASARIISADTLFTDDSATYWVQGQRSDDSAWEWVSSRWENSTGLAVEPVAPERSDNWTFSPLAPGSGWVRVTMGTDSLTAPDTVQVVFLRSPPTIVELEVLTPADHLIAGDTIVAVVRIKNRDGLVPGMYCDPSAYHQDSLGASKNGTPPIVIVEGNDTTLNQVPSSSVRTNECFSDGLDTVRYILTYAPADPDSLHHLFATVNGAKGEAPGFRLLPAAISQVVLEYLNGSRVTDTLTLYFNQPPTSKVFFSRGYDRFGNSRGDEPSNWTTDGTLHAVSGRATNIARMYYDASNVRLGESGYIRATAVDTSNGVRYDQVYIIIPPAPIQLIDAVTQDTNANGYLDGMVLRFDRPVTLPSDTAELRAMLNQITLSANGVDWTALAIIGLNGTLTDTAFRVVLAEDTTQLDVSGNHIPQTGWRPYIAISGIPGAESVPPGVRPMTDGAPPVVWSVTKYIQDGKADRVVVKFSEAVTPLNQATRPGDIFNVLRYNRETGQWDTVSVLLDSLMSLTSMGGDSLVFVMNNGQDLPPGYYLNVKLTAGLSDDNPSQSGANTPVTVADNHKAKVQVKGSTRIDLKIWRNPAAHNATVSGVPPGTFQAFSNQTAYQSAKDGNGGLAATATLTVPSSGTIDVYRIIYDLAGNIVIQDRCTDLIKKYLENGESGVSNASSITYYLFWNGYNKDGLPVAAGVYREITIFSYTNGSQTKRAVTNWGVVEGVAHTH